MRRRGALGFFFQDAKIEIESLEWNLNRTLSKLNYRIHTDAVKAHLISAIVTPAQAAESFLKILLEEINLRAARRQARKRLALSAPSPKMGTMISSPTRLQQNTIV